MNKTLPVDIQGEVGRQRFYHVRLPVGYKIRFSITTKSTFYRQYDLYPNHFDCFKAAFSYIVLNSKCELVNDDQAPIF